MSYQRLFSPKRIGLAVAQLAFIALAFNALPAMAQNPQIEEKLIAMKQNMAANQQKLAMYIWTETETIIIKGDVKDTKTYQVQMVNGQQQKNLVNDQKADAGRREGRIRERVVEKKTDEYEAYGQQIGALAKQYSNLDPDRLLQSMQQGNVSLTPGAQDTKIVISNFVKPGDSITLTIDPQSKQLQSIRVASYPTDQSDGVTISTEFAQLVDGTNHVASTLINGISKHLTINQVNSNYLFRN